MLQQQFCSELIREIRSLSEFLRDSLFGINYFVNKYEED